MKSLACVVVVALTTIGAAGCTRSKSDTSNSSDKVGSRRLANPKITIARGCLTGTDNQFVLTSLEHGAPDSTAADRQPAGEPISATESYRLVGMDDRLRGLVGQRVEVTGDSAPDQVVDMVSATPSNAPTNPPSSTQPADPQGGAAVGTAGNEPKVSTASRARIEIHDLRVSSVTPLGDKCAS
jgi:hypothetical protein